MLKKTLTLTLAGCMLATGLSGCSVLSGLLPDNNKGDGDKDYVKVTPIDATLLEGKIANFMEAEGVGIIDKTDEVEPEGQGTNPYLAVAYADNNAGTQKKMELAKKTANGYSNVHFHNADGGARKSYKHLNKKYNKHHHKTVECPELDCEKISDEILAEEESGAVDSILSLDARVNKLYSVGQFTFVNISSAVEGNVKVYDQRSRSPHMFSEIGGFPTKVNVEENMVRGEYTFAYINFKDENGNNGMIPIKVDAAEEKYHRINYWSDAYNQSFIIDNATGMTYSLSQFKYIYSVEGGVIKIYDESVMGKFVFYKPQVTETGMQFIKVELPTDETFIKGASYAKVFVDIYGNMVFSNGELVALSQMDIYGEIKYDGNIILAQKNQEIYSRLESSPATRNKAEVYKRASRYHVGSDGRIYRVNFMGDMSDVSVNVLDENCTWQQVGNDVDVQFEGYIAWNIGLNKANFDHYRILCIKNGNAYFSTAAMSDGKAIWPQATFDGNTDQFVGVVKAPAVGGEQAKSAIMDYISEFKTKVDFMQGGYSVVLVGSTQMLYVQDGKVNLRDVTTGQEVSFDANVTARSCVNVGDKLFVDGLGYLSVEKEYDLSTFGASNFSAEYLEKTVELDEYYKLLLDLKK